jgi:hypothetical protein
MELDEYLELRKINCGKERKTCPCASLIEHKAMKTYGGVEV